MRVDFLRLRFDGALELRLGGFLGGLDETFPDDELARLGVVEKGDFTFGFFRVFEAFLLLLFIIVVWSSVVFDVITVASQTLRGVKRERENPIRKMHPQNGKRHDLTTTTICYTSFADTRDWSSCALPVRRPNAHIFCWSSHVTSTSWAFVAGPPRDDILDA